MKALVVGGDGFVGSNLVAVLVTRGHDVLATTRRRGSDVYFLDLAGPITWIPSADVVFIVAAVNTFQACEGNPQAFRVNVDAPVEIARLAVHEQGAFPVFVSSDCVEWCGATAYARHKALAELGVRMAGGAVVRPSRIAPERVGNFCDLLIDIGARRAPGVHHWKNGPVAC